jgi:RimJ/RimL family protein N-acetyltransferase
MLRGERICLRPITEDDWPTIEEWGRSRESLWGEYQRWQLDHLPQLRRAYQSNRLLSRASALLLIERLEDNRAIGFVRYTLSPFPDADLSHPEIGFGIAEKEARGKGFAQEALALLLGYLFAGYPAQRVTALTEAENRPAQRLMEKLGFRHEGTLRRSTFRDGQWRDLFIYGILRDEWTTAGGAPTGH